MDTFVTSYYQTEDTMKLVGDIESAYQGSYTVKGNHIEYQDDTGFTANGDFVNGVLYHAGMVLYREELSEGRNE